MTLRTGNHPVTGQCTVVVSQVREKVFPESPLKQSPDARKPYLQAYQVVELFNRHAICISTDNINDENFARRDDGSEIYYDTMHYFASPRLLLSLLTLLDELGVPSDSIKHRRVIAAGRRMIRLMLPNRTYRAVLGDFRRELLRRKILGQFDSCFTKVKNWFSISTV